MRKTMAIILLAILGIGSFSFVTNLANADTQIEGTWVRMRGIITNWGSNPVFGWIGAQAGMVDKNGTYHEWARVHATWSYDKPRLNCSEPPPLQNFTVTVYATRLVNLTDVSLDNPECDFYVSGLWNVVRITINITVIIEENSCIITIERLPEEILHEANGELRVFLVPRFEFVLRIEGIDPLFGVVRVFDFRHVEIKICDLNDDGEVDLLDLVRVAKRYRTVPGMWIERDHEMDFNSNAEIDIGDLTTVAANID